MVNAWSTLVNRDSHRGPPQVLELFTLLAEARQQVNLSRQLSMQRRPTNPLDDQSCRPSVAQVPQGQDGAHGAVLTARSSFEGPFGEAPTDASGVYSRDAFF